MQISALGGLRHKEGARGWLRSIRCGKRFHEPRGELVYLSDASKRCMEYPSTPQSIIEQ